MFCGWPQFFSHLLVVGLCLGDDEILWEKTNLEKEKLPIRDTESERVEKEETDELAEMWQQITKNRWQRRRQISYESSTYGS